MTPDKEKAIVFYPEEYVEELCSRITTAEYDAKVAKQALEDLRPHWAKGYSSDSIAAQVTTAALSGLWKLLKVDNQTAAMMKLQELINAQTQK